MLIVRVPLRTICSLNKVANLVDSHPRNLSKALSKALNKLSAAIPSTVGLALISVVISSKAKPIIRKAPSNTEDMAAVQDLEITVDMAMDEVGVGAGAMEVDTNMLTILNIVHHST